MQKKKIVVLSGAGISAESGLRTFRDSDGLWEGFAISEVATPGAWKKNPQQVLDFYNQRRSDVQAAVPNPAHQVLAALEADFSVQIITQNIDDLHERAGSTRVIHLHGEIFKMRSERNPQLCYPIRGDIQLGDLAEDGAQLRPHIVWFEEPVPMIEQAAAICSSADIFVVVGTSLVVYPAAGLLNFVPASIPKYILDRKIPTLPAMPNLIPIELPASEGVIRLKEMLVKNPEN